MKPAGLFGDIDKPQSTNISNSLFGGIYGNFLNFKYNRFMYI